MGNTTRGKRPAGETLARLLKVLRLLLSRREGVTVHEMGLAAGVSRRQVLRYIRSLEDAGLHLARKDSDSGSGPIWRLLWADEWTLLPKLMAGRRRRKEAKSGS